MLRQRQHLAKAFAGARTGALHRRGRRTLLDVSADSPLAARRKPPTRRLLLSGTVSSISTLIYLAPPGSYRPLPHLSRSRSTRPEMIARRKPTLRRPSWRALEHQPAPSLSAGVGFGEGRLLKIGARVIMPRRERAFELLRRAAARRRPAGARHRLIDRLSCRVFLGMQHRMRRKLP